MFKNQAPTSSSALSYLPCSATRAGLTSSMKLTSLPRMFCHATISPYSFMMETVPVLAGEPSACFTRFIMPKVLSIFSTLPLRLSMCAWV